jgi:anti-anti-sigma factor
MTPTALLVREKDDVVIVSFNEARIVDPASIQQIEQEFQDPALQAATKKKLLLDFSRVEALSSMTIGFIVRLHNQCKRQGGHLKLGGIDANIMEVFKITGLRKLLDIYPDVVKALDAFGPAGLG